MTLRFNSLKTRTALAMSSVIVADPARQRAVPDPDQAAQLRKGIEDRALTFALLTRAPICTGYEAYKDSGFYKFRELMRDLLTLDPDVVRIEIINVNGQVLFDTLSLDETGPDAAGAPRRWIQEPERLEAVKRLEYTLLQGRDAARRGDAGDHRPLRRGLEPPQAVGRLPGLVPEPRAGDRAARVRHRRA